MLEQNLPKDQVTLENLRRMAGPRMKWVYFNTESPKHMSSIPAFRHFLFNVTMSYSHESDVVAPYWYAREVKRLGDEGASTQDATKKGTIDYQKRREGSFVLGNEKVNNGWPSHEGLSERTDVVDEGRGRGHGRNMRGQRRIWINKTKEVGWVVSHCVAERKHVAERLSEMIPGVEIFGSCVGRRLSGRVADLIKDYKFYLAFENSFCPDYVTEKYWNVLGKAIPIVMGSTTTRTLIPNSYIRVEDFPTLEALAAHVRRVSADEYLYDSYFDWMDRFEVPREWGEEHWSCRLCRYLFRTRGQMKVSDLGSFYAKDQCVVPDIVKH